ncbi:MAG: hypothetical protein JWN52_51 [Actinomycetia bacterium]|nr:hypothetical protein [Actinomycetes bacterium]
MIALLASSLGVAVPDLFAGDGYVLLTPEVCQSREGLRAAFSGLPPSEYNQLHHAVVVGGKALQLRHQEVQKLAGLEADEALAKRLGVDVQEVATVAWEMFDGLTLTEERDRRAEVIVTEGAEPMGIREQQAHRGHITRELSTEIAKKIRDRRAMAVTEQATAVVKVLRGLRKPPDQ